MWCIEIDKASHAVVQVHIQSCTHAHAITYLNDNNHFRERHSLSHRQWLDITIKNGSVYLSWPINLNVCFILTLALPEILFDPILNALVGKSFHENQMVILLIKQQNKNVSRVNGIGRKNKPNITLNVDLFMVCVIVLFVWHSMRPAFHPDKTIYVCWARSLFSMNQTILSIDLFSGSRLVLGRERNFHWTFQLDIQSRLKIASHVICLECK